MDVKVGKYIIKSDPQCMWIEEEYTGKTKAGKEKLYTRRVSGYARTFNELLNNFLECRVRESTAKDVKELLANLTEVETEIKRMIEVKA